MLRKLVSGAFFFYLSSPFCIEYVRKLVRFASCVVDAKNKELKNSPMLQKRTKIDFLKQMKLIRRERYFDSISIVGLRNNM